MQCLDLVLRKEASTLAFCGARGDLLLLFQPVPQRDGILASLHP
jgi:hypothetical protein